MGVDAVANRILMEEPNQFLRLKVESSFTLHAL
ncbi:hypothetical protein SCARR_02860 [Pontiella sulfatireligans]|uniref:Uncharacterized protein n=1 Tax=Pontiella sulfatireligans TaxID=2750658 RepID=A0A6C2ULL3_9BACT|nr:hypothetical protein SCARR_02860 [Pontiella sulfatireligans]